MGADLRTGAFSWGRLERLTDRAASWSDLEAHRVDLIAARYRRAQERPVPERALEAERLARLRAIAALHLLRTVREACSGTLVVIKGLEAAAAYPDPLLRTFIDLDLLVDDVPTAHDELMAAGFEEGADPPWLRRRSDPEALFARQHHSRPLQLGGIPLKVELHRRPSWPAWLEPPDADLFLTAAVPGTTGVDGVLSLPPVHHALVLAAHSWVDGPLGRLRDLVDVSLLAAHADRAELESLARRLGAARLWRSTIGTADAVLAEGGRRTLALRTFARNVPAVRERTVVESHLEDWLSPFWTLPPRPAARRALSNLAWTFRPAAEESARAKLARALRALANARRPKSAHDAALGDDAKQFHPRQRWRGL
jgi:hypothetical protein